jgi:ATP-dependent exoDNAse (exonuclease V) alpha subunit
MTGPAGTGKSTLLERFLDRKKKDEFPYLASTGAAAIINNGRTFHSFFGLGIMEHGPDKTIQLASRNRDIRARLQRAEGIVIDEISMLQGVVLEVAEAIAQIARESHEPWGGLRIIAVGDFAQLPPVPTEQRGRDWAFLNRVWKKSKFKSIELSTVVRTTEPDFIAALHLARLGIMDPELIALLTKSAARGEPDINTLHLLPTWQQVDCHNKKMLARLKSPETKFPTRYSGSGAWAREMLEKNAPIPKVLRLKEDALIMMLTNDPKNRWANGSMGHVISIEEDEVKIELMTGKCFTAKNHTFRVHDGNGKETGSATNFPLRLGWATTIHKSQGQTLDRVCVNLANLWEPGQGYVALSRVRSAAGLFIKDWTPKSIFPDQAVVDFYIGLEREQKLLH